MTDDAASWLEVVRFANDIAMAYRRKNEQLRGEIAERDRAIEVYRKLIAESDRQKQQEGAPCKQAVSRRNPMVRA